MISDNSWIYLTDPDCGMLGLKNDTANMKGWINSIIQRINAIESKHEAIETLFVINQKIGYVKGVNKDYAYPPELYRKLETTINIMLRNRLNS